MTAKQMLDFARLSAFYRDVLIKRVVPFWLNHSRDEACGGYFDILTETGETADADKAIARQAEQVWAFAYLFDTQKPTADWLNHARHGANFLDKSAFGEKLAVLKTVDRRGKPVLAATDILPSCRVAMAFARLHRATAEDEWAMLARQTTQAIVAHRKKMRTAQGRQLGGFRTTKHLSEPLALLHLLVETWPLLDSETRNAMSQSVLDEILREFLDRRTDILREFVLPDGAFLNTPEGRRISPGLTFAVANHLFDLAQLTGNQKLTDQAMTWSLNLCEWTYDEIKGGFPRFVDWKTEPSPFATVSQRWLDVHLSALAALSKGYLHTRHPDVPRWLRRLHDFVPRVFFDAAPADGWHTALDQSSQPMPLLRSSADYGCYELIGPLAVIADSLAACDKREPMPVSRGDTKAQSF
jgi:N-acylglucosamine 2-epimerase